MNDSNNSLNPWLLPVTLGASGVVGFLAGKLFGQRHISADQILKSSVTTSNAKAKLPEAGSTNAGSLTNALQSKRMLMKVALLD